MEVWDLQVIPLDSPVAEPAQIDPELENAFICHLHDHWFCIRKVNGEWYNFDSLYAAPLHLSKFYLSAYLDTLKGSGWSIFLVRGNFPKECPMSSSEASNGYGQWLLPEDAERITKSCNSTEAPPQPMNWNQQSSDSYNSYREAEISQIEDEDLKAAIAASLLDSSAATNAAIAVSLRDSSPPTTNAVIAASMKDQSPATNNATKAAVSLRNSFPATINAPVVGSPRDSSPVTSNTTVVANSRDLSPTMTNTATATSLTDSSPVRTNAATATGLTDSSLATTNAGEAEFAKTEKQISNDATV